MLDVFLTRWRQGHRTMAYPAGPAPEMPARFAGRPALDGSKCAAGCHACAAACPTAAISIQGEGSPLLLDAGKCLFCRTCRNACPHGAIEFTREWRLAARKRENLIVPDRVHEPPPASSNEAAKFFGRSLKLRQVSAGGCNACEADVNVLGTPAWDAGRFGIQFVASPRHADGLLITGPITRNMHSALLKTYEAVPSPKVVIALGSCAISGGLFAHHPETHGGAEGILPIDLYIPGCPPHPLTTLDGLLRFIGRIPD